jgi:phosphoribosylformimino-5-aminoimidazole carboxamide ribonucleotide (ProFAR) isomerase
VNYKVLEQIASKTSLKIDFGGGLKSDADLKIAFESGANQITGGSIAIKQPEVFKSWIQQYGADKIILGADAMNENRIHCVVLNTQGNPIPFANVMVFKSLIGFLFKNYRYFSFYAQR